MSMKHNGVPIDGYGPTGRPFIRAASTREAIVTQLGKARRDGDQVIWRGGDTGRAILIAVRYDLDNGRTFGLHEVLGIEDGPEAAEVAIRRILEPDLADVVAPMVRGWDRDGAQVDIPPAEMGTPKMMVTLDRTHGRDEFLICRWLSWAQGVDDAATTIEHLLHGSAS